MEENSLRLWTKDFCGIFFAQAIVVCAHFGMMIMVPIYLHSTWGLDGIALGATISVYLGTSIVLRPFTGYLIDHLGRKMVYFPSYILFAMLFFLYPLATTVIAFAALRVLHGALWGSVMSSGHTLAVDIIPTQRRGEGIGIFGLAFNLGQTVGAAVSVFTLERFGFDGLFIACGVLMLLGSQLVVRAHAPSVTLDAKPFTLKRLFERTAIPTSVVMCLISVSFGAAINYSAFYASTTISASSSIYFLCLAGGMAFSRIFIGRIFDRSGPKRSMIISFCCILIALALKGLTRLDIPFYVSGLSMGLGCGIAIPVCQAMVNSLVTSERRGGANATFLTANDLGIFSSVVIFGWMQKEFGWEACHGLEILLIIISLMLFYCVSLPHYNSLPKSTSQVGEHTPVPH